MKEQLLLKQFEYTIPATSMAIAGLKGKHTIAEHLPLMKVNIDFENGLLKLEGDWQYMMSVNKHSEANWFAYHRERVKIETVVYLSTAINLNDPYNDGLVFPLEGSIVDGNSLSTCSGLLVIDNVIGNAGHFSNQWNISLYLYDMQFDYCEIRFKLPVFNGINPDLN